LVKLLEGGGGVFICPLDPPPLTPPTPPTPPIEILGE